MFIGNVIGVPPNSGPTGQPEYQIEIHVSHPYALTLDSLTTALETAQTKRTPGLSAH
jgi:hypothetical protein